MQTNKYLPLGSVILLKEGQHRLMVVGFCATADEKDTKIYDYMGCFFPEGIFTLENMILFNHEDIDKIFSLGFSDDEEKKFKLKLNEMVKKYVNEDNNLNSSTIEIIKNESNNENNG